MEVFSSSEGDILPARSCDEGPREPHTLGTAPTQQQMDNRRNIDTLGP